MNHFYKAWQIAEGNFFTLKENNRVGGYIPDSVDSLARQFSRYRFAENPAIDPEEIGMALQMTLNPEERHFRDYPNTGMYNPFAYLPQMGVMPLMIRLECPPLWILYAARMASVCFWSFSVWLALTWLPEWKELFFVLAALPMSFFVHASVSADVVLNATAFLLFAFVLRKIKTPSENTPAEWCFLGVGVVILASVKMVYSPLLLLLSLIPAGVWGGPARRIRVGALLVVVTLCILFLWTRVSGVVYTPFEYYNPEYRNGLDLTPGANMHLQLEGLLHNPLEILKVLWKSTIVNAPSYAASYIGKLGWNNVNLPVGWVLMGWGMIVVTLWMKRDAYLVFSFWEKVRLAGIFVSIWVLIILSQYLTWEKVGAERVMLLQGRYFMPLFPVLFLLLSGLPIRKVVIPTWFFYVWGGLAALLTLSRMGFWYY